MPNKYQGEAELKIGDERYILIVNWRVLISLEEATGMGFPALLDKLKTDASVSLITQVIWQSLKIQYPQMTFDECGEIVFGVGMGPAISAWYECFNNAWGDLNEEKPENPTPRPLRSIGKS